MVARREGGRVDLGDSLPGFCFCSWIIITPTRGIHVEHIRIGQLDLNVAFRHERYGVDRPGGIEALGSGRPGAVLHDHVIAGSVVAVLQQHALHVSGVYNLGDHVLAHIQLDGLRIPCPGDGARA